jgi:hypothetical protein
MKAQDVNALNGIPDERTFPELDPNSRNEIIRGCDKFNYLKFMFNNKLRARRIIHWEG